MAKLRVIQSIVNDDYSFVFSIDSISGDDYKRFKKYGPTSINFGGSFTNGSSITYTLPDIFFDLPTQFPVTQTFTLVAPFNSNAENKLAWYRTEMTTRITTAFTDIRAIVDGFSGEHLTDNI